MAKIGPRVVSCSLTMNNLL